MNEYHKIQTVWLRDPATNYKTLLDGRWALPEFEYLANNQWEFTEKIDGTNIRIMWDGERVTFGGKTDNAQMPAVLVNQMTERFTPKTFADMCVMCLYCEGYGAKIQSGGVYIPDSQDVILFDVNVGGTWLKREDVVDIGQRVGIGVVPNMGHGSLYDAIQMVADGFDSRLGHRPTMAEGLVMRPTVELLDRRGNRVITKVKHKDF
jgi:hypothetical protein